MLKRVRSQVAPNGDRIGHFQLDEMWVFRKKPPKNETAESDEMEFNATIKPSVLAMCTSIIVYASRYWGDSEPRTYPLRAWPAIEASGRSRAETPL